MILSSSHCGSKPVHSIVPGCGAVMDCAAPGTVPAQTASIVCGCILDCARALRSYACCEVGGKVAATRSLDNAVAASRCATERLGNGTIRSLCLPGHAFDQPCGDRSGRVATFSLSVTTFSISVAKKPDLTATNPDQIRADQAWISGDQRGSRRDRYWLPRDQVRISGDQQGKRHDQTQDMAVTSELVTPRSEFLAIRSGNVRILIGRVATLTGIQRINRRIPGPRAVGNRTQACHSKHPDGYCEALF